VRSPKYLAVGFAIILLDVSAVVGFRVMRPTPPPFQGNPAKTMGPADAPVLIVEFSDYACPFCADLNRTLNELQKVYPTQLRRIHKQFPLASHPHALKAAEASECAADQGQFWPYSDRLFAEVKDWNIDEIDPSPKLILMADKLGLDHARFQQCLESGAKTAIAMEDKRDGKRLLVEGTPVLLLNGTRVLVKRSLEDLKAVVQDALDEQKKGS
jgi:protein-disulfide isomerase